MADYAESPITGTQWQRAARVVIENPRNGTPAVTFVEERALQLGDEVLLTPVGNLVEPFIQSGNGANVEEEFALRNPLDGSLLGVTATYGELQVLLFSLYYHVAAKRDEAAPQDVEPFA